MTTGTEETTRFIPSRRPRRPVVLHEGEGLRLHEGWAWSLLAITAEGGQSEAIVRVEGARNH
jgi:hypothetical protein